MGLLVDFWAAIADWAERLTPDQVLYSALLALLAIVLANLSLMHLRLKREYRQAEADWIDTTVDRNSDNWNSTAQDLEAKARDAGEVARWSTLTYLNILDAAVDARLKGSHWSDALLATRTLLREACHSIRRPMAGEREFRDYADLIARWVQNYPDISKAAKEAPETAVQFLEEIDATLAATEQVPRTAELRDLIATAKAAVEEKKKS